MTRQELEQLCQPLTPEETVGELDNICDEQVKESGIDSEAIAIKAGVLVLEKVIEEITFNDLPPSVQIRKMIF